MEGMIFYGFLDELGVRFPQQLIVDADAVVGESLSVVVVDAFADLKKLEVIVNGFFMLFDIVVEDTN